MDIVYLRRHEAPHYPLALHKYLEVEAPLSIAALGNLDILQQKLVAFFSSQKCPGSLILKTYDLTHHLRQFGITVIGGFHSPTERECLTILLRGTQPVIVCPARGLERMRLPREYKEPLRKGRLLILSPFTEKERRPTIQMALYRNRFVAALAKSVFVSYAEPGSKTEEFCRDILAWQKPLYTFEGDLSTNLASLGAKPMTPDRVSELQNLPNSKYTSRFYSSW